MTKHWWVLIVIAIIIIGLSFSRAQKIESDLAQSIDAPKPAGAKFYPNDPLSAPPTLDPRVLKDQLRAVPKERLLADYLTWAQYPPNSRPLKSSHVDQINPRQIPLSDQRMPATDGQELIDSGHSCRLQPLAHSVYENDIMLITLSCRKSGANENSSLDIQSYRVEGRAGEFVFNPQKPEVGDNGRNGDEVPGDGIYTFEFRPDVDDWGDVFLTVEFKIGGDETGSRYSMRTHFFSSPKAPARITGIAAEELREGSLFVSVELNVFIEGNYTITANLFAGGLPVALARAHKNLTTGRQTIELEFFGKILFDRKLDGPYTVRDIRGQLDTDAIQPEMLLQSPEVVAALLAQVKRDRPTKQLIPYYDQEYTTETYLANQFSHLEYSSAAKEEQIALIENL